jgi:ABC-type polysaccharide/polyol phosphate export permease
MVAVVAGRVTDRRTARGGWYPMRARGRVTWPVLLSRTVTARSEVPSSFRSSSVRPGPLALIRLGITETLSRRRLIAYLVRADLKKAGTDTLLGNVWWVVDPLLQMLVYYVLVGVILKRGGLDYPLFVFSAILPWKWFETTVRQGTGSVVGAERVIKQINFPKLVLPLSTAFGGLVSFAFGMVPLMAMLIIIYPHHISYWLLFIPLIALVQMLFSVAMAIAASAANVFYRDIGNLARHVLRFWFYLSPALYALESVKADSSLHSSLADVWFAINPFTHLLTSYRNVIYGKFDGTTAGIAPDFGGLAAVAAVSVVLIALSILLFKRVEPSFAKVL